MYCYGANNPVKYVDPDGRTEVYFIYTYTNRKKDWVMKNLQEGGRLGFSRELNLCEGELWLSAKYISCGTKDVLKEAFSDPEARLIVISGHGYNEAAIQTADDAKFRPADIEKKSENLSVVIFENCYQGDYVDEWKEKLGDIDIITWSGTTTTSETRRFNSDGGNCRQENNLTYYLLKAFCEKWILDNNRNEE